MLDRERWTLDTCVLAPAEANWVVNSSLWPWWANHWWGRRGQKGLQGATKVPQRPYTTACTNFLVQLSKLTPDQNLSDWYWKKERLPEIWSLCKDEKADPQVFPRSDGRWTLFAVCFQVLRHQKKRVESKKCDNVDKCEVWGGAGEEVAPPREWFGRIGPNWLGCRGCYGATHTNKKTQTHTHIHTQTHTQTHKTQTQHRTD